VSEELCRATGKALRHKGLPDRGHPLRGHRDAAQGRSGLRARARPAGRTLRARTCRGGAAV